MITKKDFLEKHSQYDGEKLWEWLIKRDVIDDPANEHSATDLAHHWVKSMNYFIKKSNLQAVLGERKPGKSTIKALRTRIAKIQRQHTVLPAHLDLICQYAVEFWGSKPEMQPFVHYSTLLGSVPKYEKYLAQGRHHHQIKVQRQRKTRTR